ncbi:MAG TPA: CRISPR-associated endonuclease Cas1 [Candidatus Ratteibacteria bacterium]|uniref:CRISPR-associated endonuclease Cas1 n=1 Tax=candidate division TA06 bacterium ADurb.Bin131 TaxID=1852827 RepID=A0A1V6CEG6_UNCT6|nr:MAG: CRISPR-associated endonuclease Cas1 [candidate division TA06 bacterium ADurb.Bin131]HOC02806.1 CRISPR-associated endonuclease Cas1 [bacterium]HRS05493.1 CRISPR-associated endonuclease Cas1 [Candidatus Ratteibacteria bacterium]HON06294.1 CRISPR-associated endonuclease Cas1 [bacterium]HOQ82419.1 CRISPR-associated endonuclease Cas1 [bacterium]
MATIYLIEQGAKLIKEQKKIVIEKEGQVLLEIPDFKVERVFIFGNIQITTQAMKFLLESGIETSFFNIWGRLIGKLSPIESKNVYLRIQQYEKHKNPEFVLSYAKIFVEGKIKNMKVVLQKYSHNHPEIDFSQSIAELDGCSGELMRKVQVSSILGVEGRASAIYFECFSKMLRKGFMFEGRIKRPPPDPVNSLLSLGYSLITNEMLSTVSGIGFDPYIGFLHTLEYGRPSLPLDLIEEFRQSIVDRLTLEIINKEIINQDDFEEKEAGVYLKDAPRKKYFEQYEKRMQTEITSPETNQRQTYRKLMFIQAQKLAKSLLENQPYIPFTIR